ncbi:hypothetical protein MBLNU13_g04665t3 [Cladosporium sp. NU13]
MTRINISYLLALGLLGTAVASPAPRPIPQSQQEVDPNPSLTYSLRDPEVTDYQTQNGTGSAVPTTTSARSSADQTADASPTLTEIAAFTAPNGGKYTATAIDGTLRIAGYQLTEGGPDALVGGIRVSVASEGLIFGGNTAAYQTVTGVSTSEVVSTSTDASGNTQVVSSSATVAVTAESTGSTTASGSESASGSTAAASSSAAASTGGAAAGATAESRGAVVALGGIAALLCIFA